MSVDGKRVLGITLVFGLAAGIAYWLYLYLSTGSAPSPSDLWSSAKGAVGLGALSQSDVSGYASNAGFAGGDLNTAVAIAQAESSFNPAAVGDLDITPGGSIGLWQINLKAHPEYTAAQLQDPQTNANAAYAIYQAAGNQFTPWSTFNSGAYAQYLPSGSATTASNAATSDDSTGSAASATGDNPAPDSETYGASNNTFGGLGA